MASALLLECPLCDFTDTESYFLQLHVEEVHREDAEAPTLKPSAAAMGSPGPQRQPRNDTTQREDEESEEESTEGSGDDEIASGRIMGQVSFIHFRSANRVGVSVPSARRHICCYGSGDEKSKSVLMRWQNRTSSQSQDPEFILCPRPRCGEALLVSDLEDHLELHWAEGVGLETNDPSTANPDSGDDSTAGMDGSSVGTNDENDSDTQQASNGERTAISVKKNERLRGKHSASPFKNSDETKRRKKTGTVRAADSKPPTQHHQHHRRRRRREDSTSSVPLLKSKGAVSIATSKRPDAETRRQRKHGLRLGKSELGPYAYEERMPDWLYRQLAAGGRVTVMTRINPATGRLVRTQNVENEHPGIVPVIASLIAESAKGPPRRATSSHARSMTRTRNGAVRVGTPSPLARLPNNIVAGNGNDVASSPTGNAIPTEVWLCDPAVFYVGKTPGEGGFCGYRNLQMLLSYMLHSNAPGSASIRSAARQPTTSTKIPGVLVLQDWIENAWDQGIHELGRAQTGGIRGTRKFIGTPEAHALFLSLDISCRVATFHDQPAKDEVTGQKAYEALLEWTESYFRVGATLSPSTMLSMGLSAPFFTQQPSRSSPASLPDPVDASPSPPPTIPSRSSSSSSAQSQNRPGPRPIQTAPETPRSFNLHKTHLPPVYLQQPGHSLTIIGFERRGSSTHLLVFDPLFNPSSGMRDLVSGDGRVDAAAWFNGAASTPPGKPMSSPKKTREKRGAVPARADKLLKAYRRGRRELERYSAFEVLALG
jgi:hypothetical protein